MGGIPPSQHADNVTNSRTRRGGDHTHRRRQKGQGPFAIGIKQAFTSKTLFEPFELEVQLSLPRRQEFIDIELVLPAASYTPSDPVATTLCPSSGRKRKNRFFPRNMTHFRRPRSSLSVKYICPDA